MAYHTIHIDEGTHKHVIGDYSQNPVIADMDQATWQNYYNTEAGFAAGRTGNPTAAAFITSKGTGKWTNDWLNEWKDPYEELKLTSDGAADFDSVVAVDADGIATHTITVQKIDEDGADVTTGSEAIRILSTTAITISDANPSLTNGTVQITIGPSNDVCDIEITAADPATTMRRGKPLKIRFK